MKQIFIVALLATGLYTQSCKKQSNVTTEQADIVTNATPGTSTTNPSTWAGPVEYVFGNSFTPGWPCQVEFATCGILNPTYPFPGNMNRLISAPANIEAIGNNHLQINIDGTQLDPFIYNHALAGYPFLFSHPITLPQTAVNAACQAAGTTPPTSVTIPAGSYPVATPGIPWSSPNPKPSVVVVVIINVGPDNFRITISIRFR